MDDNLTNAGTVLDCHGSAHGLAPDCKMSMANTAEALYHREMDTSLSTADNNDNNKSKSATMRECVVDHTNSTGLFLHIIDYAHIREVT